MFVFIVRRILQTIPVLLGVSLVVFLIMQMVPGDPATLLAGEGATKETIEMIRHQLGLDRPILYQYFDYVIHAVQGDFGESLRSSRPVLDEILVRLPITLELALASIFITVVLGMVAGIISATKQYSATDISIMIVALLGISLPSFWLGLMLIYFFSVNLQWFPVSGWGTINHMILPAITLGAGGGCNCSQNDKVKYARSCSSRLYSYSKSQGIKRACHYI